MHPIPALNRDVRRSVDHHPTRIRIRHQFGQLEKLGVQLLRFGLQLDDVELGQPAQLQRQNVIGLFGIDREPLLQSLAGLVDGVGSADHRHRGVDVQVDGHQAGHQMAPRGDLLQSILAAAQHHRIAQVQECGDQFPHRPPTRHSVLIERNQAGGERRLQRGQGE